MIRRVTVRNFKRFQEEAFELADTVVLAGPNNSGKSTLLQAIATWKLGLDRWVAQRSGSQATRRTGVSILRSEFTAVPLREMNLFWEGRQVAGGGERAGQPRRIEIILEGDDWSCGLEFQYANPEMIYVRPLGAAEMPVKELRKFPPAPARELNVVHIPPLSGIERDEPRRDRGYQDLLIGLGRPGEILRNLLLEVSEREEDWEALTRHVEALFQIELRPPSYSPGQPFILCEYRERGSRRFLDLASAGSGFLQVLLILAFFYARPATVLLLDEPDAHLHVILQRQTYDLLRRIAAERGSQLILATHSEVLLDATDPERVIAFIGPHPRPLLTKTERDQVREALKRLSTTDLILGREVGAVLYTEGASDAPILREWARILNHPLQRFLGHPYIHLLKGRNLDEAKAHFFALRAAFPDIRGACLLDGDNKEEPDREMTKRGLLVLRWRRYEIENYLLVPETLRRFVREHAPLGPLAATRVDRAFSKLLPPNTDPFADHVAQVHVKASSDFLLPLLEEVGLPLSKGDLYKIAATMRPEEIHPEVREKLDLLYEHLLGGRT